MAGRKPDSLLHRAALGFWFCAIAALGLLQFYGRSFREATFSPDTPAWIWLAGSLMLLALGLWIIVRAARK